MSYGRATVNDLLERGWRLADSEKHPLGILQGKGLNSYRLVVLLGAKSRTGASYFQIFLKDASGAIGSAPVVIGLRNAGSYPSYNWIEIARLSLAVGFASGEGEAAITAEGLAPPLFQYLADLIPPGGHMMVEYDSPGQQDTARSLAMGVPPVATPLGYLLFSVGCGTSFKDWYIAEGGSEGPRKLQGYKALNSQHAQDRSGEMARELQGFLGRMSVAGGSEPERAARERALVVLGRLGFPADSG